MDHCDGYVAYREDSLVERIGRMISLIVATKSRVAELDRLLASLEVQTYRDFEVIVIDQNPDDRLVPVVQRVATLAIRHLRCAPGASRARNVGLRAALGDIIAFPDDDCWYPEQLLENVKEQFAAHREWDGLLGVLRQQNHQLTGPKWPQVRCAATAETIWKCGITPVAFLTRATVETAGFFDERVGPGSPSGYQSGEDMDYMLRCLEAGSTMWHLPDLTVHHPDFHDLTRIAEKAYPYAKGGGLMLRVHKYPLGTFLNALMRSFAGAGVFLFRCSFRRSWSYLLRGAGLFRGYFYGERDVGSVSAVRKAEV